ncbi:hypothetical protein YYG_05050 [Plasmodium vinckei petteri]|uniref:Uncharacterized protein n=1 Tax=Plasmodium vinckei petteri TaxID=138298 RepID=W7ALS4_PLAVN|nr:hypothetical protein YYG_05050 [Plasmodium vinckei petteri]
MGAKKGIESERGINKILAIRILVLNLTFIWILAHFTNDIPVTLHNGEIVIKNKFDLRRIRILASIFEDVTQDSNNDDTMLMRYYQDPLDSFYKSKPKTKERINERKLDFMKKIYPNVINDNENSENQFLELRTKALAPVEKRNQGLLDVHNSLLSFSNYASDMKAYGSKLEEVKKNMDSFRNTCELQFSGIKDLLSNYMDSCESQIKEVGKYLSEKNDSTNNLPEEKKSKDIHDDTHANDIYSQYYSDKKDSAPNDRNSSLAKTENSKSDYDENYGVFVDENKTVYEYIYKKEYDDDDIPYISEIDSSDDTKAKSDYATISKKQHQYELKDTANDGYENNKNDYKIDEKHENPANNNHNDGIKNTENKNVADSNNQQYPPKTTYKEKTTIIMNFGTPNNESQDDIPQISESYYVDVTKLNNDNYGKDVTNVTGNSNIKILKKDTTGQYTESNNVPNKPTGEQQAPSQQAKQQVPGQQVQRQQIPGQQVPGQQVPKQQTPGQQIPGQQVQRQQAPGPQVKQQVPGQQVQRQQIPGQQVPGQKVPGQQAPGQQVQRQQIPGQQIPGQQVQRQQIPGQQIPGQQVQRQQIPGQQVPGQQVPKQQVPGPQYYFLNQVINNKVILL